MSENIGKLGGEEAGRTTSIVRVAAASWIGTSVEWYDFFLYGTAAALVLGPLFFSPKFSPLAAQLAAFATFWVGFGARPVGGIVFGHFGDRIGRKTMLVLTLVIMGVATFLVGCLPPYSVFGIWAPVLLVILRFCQGFAVGGEWGGAVLMATEHSPEGRRGFYGSWPQMGVPIGVLLSSLLFSWVSVSFSKQDFLAFLARHHPAYCVVVDDRQANREGRVTQPVNKIGQKIHRGHNYAKVMPEKSSWHPGATQDCLKTSPPPKPPFSAGCSSSENDHR